MSAYVKVEMKDQSVYGSHRCTAKADSTGLRCKCRSAKGRKCWHHTLRDLNLRVKKSGVPAAGMGLYSGKRPFKKGQRVNYTGEAMSRAKVDARYPGSTVAQYTYCRSKTQCTDARRTDEKGLGRWVNDARGTGKHNNARLSAHNASNTYSVIFTRNIPADTEIFAAYGSNYWRG